MIYFGGWPGIRQAIAVLCPSALMLMAHAVWIQGHGGSWPFPTCWLGGGDCTREKQMSLSYCFLRSVFVRPEDLQWHLCHCELIGWTFKNHVNGRGSSTTSSSCKIFSPTKAEIQCHTEPRRYFAVDYEISGFQLVGPGRRQGRQLTFELTN